jgi:hypothetical protein
MADIITKRTRVLKFHSVSLPIIRRDGEVWLRYLQIGDALGYKNPHVLNKVYQNNAAEFTDRMTALVKLPSAGGEQETRIFSLRGAHLLGMFARTARAAEFRRWVLDVLDASAQGAHLAPKVAPAALPAPVPALPKPSLDVDKAKAAMDAANVIAGRVQSEVFQQIMETGEWVHDRWMLTFNFTSKGTYPHVSLIERDAFVMSLARLATAIVEPNGMLPDNTELANLAAACNQRLAQRLEYQAHQKAVTA